MKELVIAIDPDVDKSGVAMILKEDRKATLLSVSAEPFFDMMDHIIESMTEHISTDSKCRMVVEAGWLNQITNYHGVSGRQGQRVAYQVGRNHQVGMLLLEWAGRYAMVEPVAAKPLAKCWNGKDRKISHCELVAICDNLNFQLPKQTNQEMRDAVLLAIVYANLPIKFKSCRI